MDDLLKNNHDYIFVLYFIYTQYDLFNILSIKNILNISTFIKINYFNFFILLFTLLLSNQTGPEEFLPKLSNESDLLCNVFLK